jgi:hypothetical protein
VIPLAFEVAAAPDLFPGHSLSFTDVGFDDVGIRIEYAIDPALAMRSPGVGWVGRAHDDLGNEYEDVGGAYGPARDGHRTEGVLTLPFPVDEASAIRVRIWPDGDGEAYELIVSLDL